MIVGGLEKAGALELMVSFMQIGSTIPPALFDILVIWVVASLSAVVEKSDNRNRDDSVHAAENMAQAPPKHHTHIAEKC